MNTDTAITPPPALPWGTQAPALREADIAALGPAFYTRLPPTPLPAPHWVGRSRALAAELGLGADWLDSDEALQRLSGNLADAEPATLATVYSGHQFGVWAGQLGDGRALVLGQTASGHEVQLKGAGRTPYSRMGDGRAVLRSSIREFLCSEAMHALGIPTTRALCVTGSPAPVRRESIETAAVVTRTAPSFIRFGHFEHFASTGQHGELKALADLVLQRHYPDCMGRADFGGNPYAAMLQAVSERTAAMVAQWQAVGFCHGVMNTDNMSILGLTIDYGPFQFLDAFVPNHICNHSDEGGRYAYNRQPNIAYWNLYCLAQALLPLIDDQVAVAALESYKTVFPAELQRRMGAKLGFDAASAASEERRPLIENVLQLLAKDGVDFSIFWRRLSDHVAGGEVEAVRDLFVDRAALDGWLLDYQAQSGGLDRAQMAERMVKANPKYVLRNHLGEQAIVAARGGDFSELERLYALLQSPFDEHPDMEKYADFPPDWARSIEISCSS